MDNCLNINFEPVETPVKEMTNKEIYIELQELSVTMDQLYKDNQLHERNVLVPRWRELSRAYDWGYKVHERIETIAWYGRWEEAVITEHDHVMNRFYVQNDKGWKIGVPGNLIRKIGAIEEVSEEHLDQLVLF